MTDNTLHDAAAILAGWPRLVEDLRATTSQARTAAAVAAPAR